MISKSSFCLLELGETGLPKYIFKVLLGRPASFNLNMQKLFFRYQSKKNSIKENVVTYIEQVGELFTPDHRILGSCLAQLVRCLLIFIFDGCIAAA